MYGCSVEQIGCIQGTMTCHHLYFSLCTILNQDLPPCCCLHSSSSGAHHDDEFGFGNAEDLYDEIGGGGISGGGRRAFNSTAIRKQDTLQAPDSHTPDSLPIPALVRSCMRWLDKRNRLAIEGIFREAGP